MFYCDLSINRVFVIFLVTAVVCVFVIMLGPEDHRKPQLDKSYDPSTPTRLPQARMSPSHHAAARMPRDQGGKEETVLSEALCNAASMPEIARETAIKRILASACEKHPEFVAGVLRNLMISHSGKIGRRIFFR